MRSLFGFPLLGGAFLALTSSCEGPAGPPGDATIVDAGASGPVGPSGPVGLAEGGLAVGCLSPCHGFNGIVAQWQTSTHNLAVLSNVSEVATWTGAASCGNCHASDGFPRRLAGTVAPMASLPPNVKLGENNYLASTGATKEVTYSGESGIATIGCATCHDTGATDDPHLTGGLYVAGSFKLRAPTGANDQMYLEKSPVVGIVTGTPAGKWGVSNTCIGCHKSRQDVTQYITASTNVTSTHWGPHEGPHADIFTGLGGYMFAGQTYKNSTHQTLEGCAACHMPKTAENTGYPDHSMKVKVATCQTAGCHAGVTSFDVLGGQSTVQAALGELRDLLNTAGYLTRGTATPYPALSPTDLADLDLTLDQARPTTGLTADQAGALYDYFLVVRGAASGVHNPFYTKELVYDAVFSLKGAAPAAIPARP